MAMAGGSTPAEIKNLVAAGADVNWQDEILGNTILHAAVISFSPKKFALVKFLLEKGANPGKADKKGNTCLHALFTHSAVIANKISMKEFLAIASILLDKLPDPNLKNLNGETPLHIACDQGLIEVVELLITRKADLNAANEEGRTPVFYAIRSMHKKALDIVELLLAKGAAARVKDKSGQTPSDLAKSSMRGDILAVLKKHAPPTETESASEDCIKNIRKLQGTVDMYDMENSGLQGTMEPKAFSDFQNKCLEKKYLKELVTCPGGGIYELKERNVHCSKHGDHPGF